MLELAADERKVKDRLLGADKELTVRKAHHRYFKSLPEPAKP
jgi:hypothetical protein